MYYCRFSVFPTRFITFARITKTTIRALEKSDICLLKNISLEYNQRNYMYT